MSNSSCCWPVGKRLALNSGNFICCFLVSGEVGRGVCTCAHTPILLVFYIDNLFFSFCFHIALARISGVILRRNDGRGTCLVSRHCVILAVRALGMSLLS